MASEKADALASALAAAWAAAEEAEAKAAAFIAKVTAMSRMADKEEALAQADAAGADEEGALAQADAALMPAAGPRREGYRSGCCCRCLVWYDYHEKHKKSNCCPDCRNMHEFIARKVKKHTQSKCTYRLAHFRVDHPHHGEERPRLWKQHTEDERAQKVDITLRNKTYE
jgi:PHP family Zn ribbon phosphoesterase